MWKKHKWNWKWNKDDWVKLHDVCLSKFIIKVLHEWCKSYFDCISFHISKKKDSSNWSFKNHVKISTNYSKCLLSSSDLHCYYVFLLSLLWITQPVISLILSKVQQFLECDFTRGLLGYQFRILYVRYLSCSYYTIFNDFVYIFYDGM